ncbi:uncharacterized protein B0P05DRAFT_562621 [Gilbertella persicaria]|uniref:uncharacterized protein n=1 Tax=Gilbertella persicaria TaxID=101096 RepID=UPI00221FEB72|nr:uncharacterized protein B0P05DRAFT_562621 [Gilbertella persicaria]KAI8051404.1 hypothetical protein B0P05DRAFT_562621 [Gilbertella persicaria]
MANETQLSFLACPLFLWLLHGLTCSSFLPLSHHVPLSLDSISYWLHDVSLFDSAWRQVSVGHWQWLWSHQLCSLTVSVWTPILAIEGNRRGIPYIWAYMLLGQVVAISVASSLFFAVMLAYTPTQEPSYGLLKRIAACVVGGLITVILSPFVAEGDGFMPNLLVMHILLILPLMRSNTTPQKPSQAIMMMYTLAAGANLAIYVNQWFECIFSLSSFSLSGMLDAWITVFFHHPAQSSISSDIVCMQLISIAWMWTQHTSILLISLTPIFSASVTLPLHFAWTEYQKSIKAK